MIYSLWYELSTLSGEFHPFVVKRPKGERQTVCEAYVPLLSFCPVPRRHGNINLDTSLVQGFYFSPCNVWPSTPEPATLLAGSKPSYCQPCLVPSMVGKQAMPCGALVPFSLCCSKQSLGWLGYRTRPVQLLQGEVCVGGKAQVFLVIDHKHHLSWFISVQVYFFLGVYGG